MISYVWGNDGDDDNDDSEWKHQSTPVGNQQTLI